MSLIAKPREGFVLGKFMPPHQGHVFLCEFARGCCEHLTILVCSMEGDPIPGALRFQWMKEMFPDCTVLHETRDLPQAPSCEDDLEFWERWRGVVAEAMCRSVGTSSQPDVVFASENYGQRLADVVDAKFVPCDIARTACPISGTAIRNDPLGNWKYIPPVVRPYYVKRVILFGPESTGKTSLAAQLARHYQTVAVPEYGRTYTEAFGSDCTPDDFRRIVMGHIASVAAAERQANRILIEDTDPVMTAVWSDILIGSREPWLAEFSNYGDLYLLTDIDMPWIDDGTRYFHNEGDRTRFFERCETELIQRGVRYRRVSGDAKQRLSTAIAAIDELLAGK